MKKIDWKAVLAIVGLMWMLASACTKEVVVEVPVEVIKEVEVEKIVVKYETIIETETIVVTDTVYITDPFYESVKRKYEIYDLVLSMSTGAGDQHISRNETGMYNWAIAKTSWRVHVSFKKTGEENVFTYKVRLSGGDYDTSLLVAAYNKYGIRKDFYSEDGDNVEEWTNEEIEEFLFQAVKWKIDSES